MVPINTVALAQPASESSLMHMKHDGRKAATIVRDIVPNLDLYSAC